MAGNWNRATMFFDDGKFGWSESYFDTTQGHSLADTLAQAVPLAKARAAMLAGSTSAQVGAGNPHMSYMRISSTAGNRKVLFASPNGQVAAGPKINTGFMSNGADKVVLLEASDNPYSAILLLLGTQNFHVSKRAISAVPDQVILDQGEKISDPWWGPANSFAKLLAAGAWGSLALDVPNPIPLAAQIQNVVQNAQGQPVITVAAPINVSPNMRLTISGYVAQPKTPVLNGSYRVTPGVIAAGAATVFTLKAVFKPLFPAHAGFAYLYGVNVDRFVSATYDRPVKKSRGRPFDAAHGRSKSRR